MFHVSRFEQPFSPRNPERGATEGSTSPARTRHVTAPFAATRVPSRESNTQTVPRTSPPLAFSSRLQVLISLRGGHRSVLRVSHLAEIVRKVAVPLFQGLHTSSPPVRASGSPFSRRPGGSKLSGSMRGASVRLFIKTPAAV